MLPDFSEFAASITPEQLDAMAKGDGLRLITARLKAPEDLAAAMSAVCREAVTRSYQLSLDLLALYHQWLSEQL